MFTNKDLKSIGFFLRSEDLVAVGDLNIPLDELDALKKNKNCQALKRTYLLHT